MIVGLLCLAIGRPEAKASEGGTRIIDAFFPTVIAGTLIIHSLDAIQAVMNEESPAAPVGPRGGKGTEVVGELKLSGTDDLLQLKRVVPTYRRPVPLVTLTDILRPRLKHRPAD
jgi:hypothetical protein